MQLDHVREIKSQWRDQALAVAVPLAPLGWTPSLAAAPLALGIAPGRHPGDFRVALRYATPGPDVAAQLRHWTDRARGEVDVRQVGPLRPLADTTWYRAVRRPLQCGVSLAHCRSTAGTLGAFVRRTAHPGAVFALSNSHVLALEGRAQPGDAVLQPGPGDGGQPHHGVAHLHLAAPLQRGVPNAVDAALAEVLPTHTPPDPARLRGLGRVLGVCAQPPENLAMVSKLGRTTGLTRGRVTAVEVDHLQVNYDLGTLQFDGQIEIEGVDNAPFARPGDSGALVVGADGLAVGLLFCGSERGGQGQQGLAYAHPMDAVLSALDAELIC